MFRHPHIHALHMQSDYKEESQFTREFPFSQFSTLFVSALQHSPKLLSNSAQILATLLEYVKPKAVSYQSYVLCWYNWVYKYECPSNFALLAAPRQACDCYYCCCSCSYVKRLSASQGKSVKPFIMNIRIMYMVIYQCLYV